jgi:hypothetical protein
MFQPGRCHATGTSLIRGKPTFSIFAQWTQYIETKVLTRSRPIVTTYFYTTWQNSLISHIRKPYSKTRTFPASGMSSTAPV